MFSIDGHQERLKEGHSLERGGFTDIRGLVVYAASDWHCILVAFGLDFYLAKLLQFAEQLRAEESRRHSCGVQQGVNGQEHQAKVSFGQAHMSIHLFRPFLPSCSHDPYTCRLHRALLPSRSSLFV